MEKTLYVLSNSSLMWKDDSDSFSAGRLVAVEIPRMRPELEADGDVVWAGMTGDASGATVS